jgi:hypothetical protein
MAGSVASAQSVVDPTLDAYLSDLTAALELPSDERIEVRDEIGGHLVDLRSELIETGLSAESAGAEAIRRLGPPEVLAREIAAARQTRRALLAAIGGATWAAAGAAFRGLIVGVAGVVVLATSGLLVVAAANRLGAAAASWTLWVWDAGWFTPVGVAAFWVAAWFGGRTLVAVAARRSHRPAERVRPWVAAIGGIVVSLVALVWFRSPQNLASVIALAIVPGVFVMAALTGADRPIERSRGMRRTSAALFVTVLVAVPVLVWIGATPAQSQVSGMGSGPYASMLELLHATGFDLPGRFVADVPEFGSTTWTVDHGLAIGTVGTAAAVTARWHDLRLEAWRATPSGGELDRGFSAPFATAPLAVQAGQLVGAVRVDRTRDVSLWFLVVTGVAADGGRDVIATLGGSNSTFTGSAMDWLTAP